MVEKHETIYVIEDEPPATRPRWYCHDHPVGFDDLDQAVEWGLTQAPTVIVRTLGQVFYRAGDPSGDTDDRDQPPRPWPPSQEERIEIDTKYEDEWRAADARDAAYERYRNARDEWLLEQEIELLGTEPLHRCFIDVPGGGTITFEEYEAQLCAAWHEDTGVSAFGSAVEVVSKASCRDLSDLWVEAVGAALARERTWRSSRRQFLDVRVGSGELFHVTIARNRDSIREHGLDWKRMNGRGIAGSTDPELDAIFLCDSLIDAEFFTWMGREPLDIWGVRVDGLIVESGPDGWWIVNDLISPDRLRVAVAGLIPKEPEPSSTHTGFGGYMRVDRRDDGSAG